MKYMKTILYLKNCGHSGINHDATSTKHSSGCVVRLFCLNQNFFLVF